jgi:hypothetical protein
MNGYVVMNSWMRFTRANPRLIKPAHWAVMHACYGLANERGWKKEFQMPTKEVMELTGICDKELFYKILKQLVEFGALTITEESVNKYNARWVTLENLDFYLSEIPTTEPTTKPLASPTTEPTATLPNIKVNRSKEIKESNSADGAQAKVFFELTENDKGVTICQTLRSECKVFFNEHKGLYEDEMYSQFLEYWSVPNGKSIPKWYSEKTKKNGSWSLAQRLSTWSKRYNPKNEAAPRKLITIPDRLKPERV